MKKKTAKGNIIDLDIIKRSQAKTRAVGNMKVNTLGDEVDSKNNVVRTRDQIVAEFYMKENNNVPKAGPVGESSEVRTVQPNVLPSAEERAKAAANDLTKKRKNHDTNE